MHASIFYLKKKKTKTQNGEAKVALLYVVNVHAWVCKCYFLDCSMDQVKVVMINSFFYLMYPASKLGLIRFQYSSTTLCVSSRNCKWCKSMMDKWKMVTMVFLYP